MSALDHSQTNEPIDLSLMQLCRVRFRFIIGNTKSSRMSKLFFVYCNKWSALMVKVQANKDITVYEYLPALRKLITKDTKVSDIIQYVEHFNSEELNMLMNAQPLFNIAPLDLKCYILAVLGLRPFHFETKIESV